MNEMDFSFLGARLVERVPKVRKDNGKVLRFASSRVRGSGQTSGFSNTVTLFILADSFRQKPREPFS